MDVQPLAISIGFPGQRKTRTKPALAGSSRAGPFRWRRRCVDRQPSSLAPRLHDALDHRRPHRAGLDDPARPDQPDHRSQPERHGAGRTVRRDAALDRVRDDRVLAVLPAPAVTRSGRSTSRSSPRRWSWAARPRARGSLSSRPSSVASSRGAVVWHAREPSGLALCSRGRRADRAGRQRRAADDLRERRRRRPGRVTGGTLVLAAVLIADDGWHDHAQGGPVRRQPGRGPRSGSSDD